MPTTSRRSWLSAFLLALVAPWLPRLAATKAALLEEEGQSYGYDVPHAPCEECESWEYTYDHLGRMTQVRHPRPQRA